MGFPQQYSLLKSWECIEDLLFPPFKVCFVIVQDFSQYMTFIIPISFDSIYNGGCGEFCMYSKLPSIG